MQAREIEELRNRMMKENMFLNSLHNKNMSVYFNAYRSVVAQCNGEHFNMR